MVTWGLYSVKVAVLTLFFASLSIRANADLSIDNLTPGEVVRYPLVIVTGTGEGKEMAIGTSWPNAIRFPIVNHRFCSVVQLKPGKNMLLLHAGSETMKFRIDYRPMTTPYKVLSVFITAADEGLEYYSTQRSNRFPIREKCDVALKLMQSFTADAMNRAGYGKKTFALELDRNQNVVVHIIRSPKTGKELRSMDPNAIYTYCYDLLKSEFPEATTKWSGLLGFTSFDPATKKIQGHVAKGGGSLALFGAGSMQWWPARFKDVPKVFSNSATVDPNLTFEDSAARHTVWANVSTAYGASLHELGHTFGLPDSPDPFSIMSRGFDYFSRSLTVVEAPSEHQPTTRSFTADELAKWDPFFAACLNYSPWFQPDSPNNLRIVASDLPTIKVVSDEIQINAPNGLRVVGTSNHEIPSWFAEYKTNPPTSLTLSRKDLRMKMQDTKLPFQLVVVDDKGNQVQIDDKL